MPEEEVHNHRYHFNSRILGGRLTQQIYRPIRGLTHVRLPVSCEPNNKPDQTAEYCGLQLETTHVYAKGSTYHLESDVFHRVSSNYCITHVTRPTPHKQFAEVIRPIHQKEEVCPFSGNLDTPTLWIVVETMMMASGIESILL